MFPLQTLLNHELAKRCDDEIAEVVIAERRVERRRQSITDLFRRCSEQRIEIVLEHAGDVRNPLLQFEVFEPVVCFPLKTGLIKVRNAPSELVCQETDPVRIEELIF